MTWQEQTLGTAGRWAVVILLLAALFLLSAFPFEIARLGEIRPAFMLMAVYYWTLLRPASLPPLLVFVIGLGLDLLTACPFGLNALVLVAVQWLTRSQRKFLLGQSFLVIWAGFALMALGAGAVQWVFSALFSLALFPVKPMLASALLSALLFPAAALPLAMAHKALADHPSSVA